MTHKKQIEKSFAYLVLLVGLISAYSLARIAQGISLNSNRPGQGPCYVEVRGSIAWPGVYGFAKSPTLGQLLEASGGSPSLLSLNKASKLTRIPCLSLVTLSRSATNKVAIQTRQIDAFHRVTLGLKLDLNSETTEGLTAIPGIGIKTAKAIVELRERTGPLKSLDELYQVPGIGRKSIEIISKYVSLTRCSHRTSNCP